MKQIEEMAKLCPFHEEDKCNLFEGEGVCDFDCYMCNYADALYNAGYRKQSDVAREIFGEIDELLSPYGTYIKTIDLEEYAELKNKYTEVEK